MLDNYPDILTAKQVSEILRCSLRAIYGAFKCGSLPGVRIGPKLIRFHKSDILEHLKGG